MRIFFDKCVKIISCVYILGVMFLSYRLVYNEYYAVMHQEIVVSKDNDIMVYPLGKIVGIYTECNGVFVIDTCEIESAENEFINPVLGVLKKGDYILEVNGIELEEKEVLVKAVNECNGNELSLKVLRNEEEFVTSITPVLGKNGKYMLGVWVKDDLAGVGTITYLTATGEFAALGHGMGDGVTKELFTVKGGDIYKSKIVGIEKGERGAPGEVKGVIHYGTKNHIGKLYSNCGEGVYGSLDQDDLTQYINHDEAYKIGNKQEIEVGQAQIISDVSGETEFYDIEISYVDYLAVNTKKGLHIKVVDEKLLELTGGIVQGMSGSPIIQKGKLIGAVTHVLINDPEKGYGIFIEEMLDRKY